MQHSADDCWLVTDEVHCRVLFCHRLNACHVAMSQKPTSHSPICRWISPCSTMRLMMTCLQRALTTVILKVCEMEKCLIVQQNMHLFPLGLATISMLLILLYMPSLSRTKIVLKWTVIKS